jgi:myo-inositol-1(or 4)-monophosphatase
MALDYINKLVEFAIQLADKSSVIAKKYFNKYVKVDSKGDIPSNAVTNADVEIEQLIRKLINEHYPEHEIIGEELENKITDSEYK